MTGRPLVLVVDDEVDIAQSVRQVLEGNLNYEVLTAESGPEALHLLTEAAPASPDLLMADYRMPQMDGLQLIRQARAMQPGLPVILITAFADLDLVIKAASQLGVTKLLRKPLQVRDVMSAALEVAGGHWMERQRAEAFRRSTETR